MAKSKRVLLGTGYLDWDRGEAVVGRYGTVSLFPSNESEEYVTLDRTCDGQFGLLLAVLKKPVPTRQNEWILGTGKLFFDDCHGRERIMESGEYVGVLPENHRYYPWMNERNVYFVKNAEVDLYFEPVTKR